MNLVLALLFALFPSLEGFLDALLRLLEFFLGVIVGV